MISAAADECGSCRCTEGELQHSVVGRPADVGPRGRGHQSGPPAPTSPRKRPVRPRNRADGPTGCASRRRQEQVGQRECRQRQEALEHLGQKRDAHHDSDESQPAPRRGCDRADQAVTGRGQQQHQQRVGIVEAEDQRRGGRARQCRTGNQSGKCPARECRRMPDELLRRAPPLPPHPSTPGAPAPTSCSYRTSARTIRSPTTKQAACRR